LLRVTTTIDIPESELSEDFIRASGPGGQKPESKFSSTARRCSLRPAHMEVAW